MIFISMCPDVKAGVLERNKGKSFGFEITEDMANGNPINGNLIVENGLLRWGQNRAQGIGSKGLDVPVESGTEVFSERKKGSRSVETISLDDVKDSQMNPILFILCSHIQLIEGIPTELKLLRIDEKHILAALITGACVFNSVPLQRCDTSNLDTKTVYRDLDFNEIFSGDSFLGKTAESRYDYSYDALLECSVRVSAEGGFSLRTIRDREYIFDKSGIEAAEAKHKERMEAEAKRKEEADAKREESMRIFREQWEQKEKERLAEEEEKKANKGKKTKKSISVKNEKVNVGAADFLRIVASIGDK